MSSNLQLCWRNHFWRYFHAPELDENDPAGQGEQTEEVVPPAENDYLPVSVENNVDKYNWKNPRLFEISEILTVQFIRWQMPTPTFTTGRPRVLHLNHS